MSSSPPHSPFQDIQIDTPPASPTHLSLDYTPEHSHSTKSTAVFDFTPGRQKRRLHGPLPPKRRRVASPEHPDELPNNQSQLIDMESAVDDGSVSDDLQHSLAPRQSALHENGYEHYLDLVLADCVGFYQISETIFVVQGWDARANTSTVSVQPIAAVLTCDS